MKNNLLKAALACVVFGAAAICPAQTAETMTFKGTVKVGKSVSYILYVGEETGDYAAFCFAKNSAIGRRILAACKNGEVCQFTAKVNQETECKVDRATQKVLSGSGKIVSIASVKPVSSKPGVKTRKG